MANPAFIQLRTGGREFIKFRKELGELIKFKVGGRFRTVCRYYVPHLTTESAYNLLEAISSLSKKFGSRAYIRSLVISSIEVSHHVGQL